MIAKLIQNTVLLSAFAVSLSNVTCSLNNILWSQQQSSNVNVLHTCDLDLCDADPKASEPESPNQEIGGSIAEAQSISPKHFPHDTRSTPLQSETANQADPPSTVTRFRADLSESKSRQPHPGAEEEVQGPSFAESDELQASASTSYVESITMGLRGFLGKMTGSIQSENTQIQQRPTLSDIIAPGELSHCYFSPLKFLPQPARTLSRLCSSCNVTLKSHLSVMQVKLWFIQEKASQKLATNILCRTF